MSDLNQSKGGIDSNQDRLMRIATFEALMNHWQQIDERQRRTWLAWLVGQLSAESLNALSVRIGRKSRDVQNVKEKKS